MTVRWRVAAAGTAAALLVAVGVWILIGRGTGPGHSPDSAPVAAGSPTASSTFEGPRPTAQQLAALAADVASGQSGRVTQAVAGTRPLPATAVAQLAALHLAFDPASIRSVAADMVSVQATTDDGKAAHWLVVLQVDPQGRWRMLTTTPQSATP